MLRSARRRAKKYNFPCTITKDDIYISEICPVLGIKMQHNNEKSKPNSPSLDKVIPKLGYVPGNICVISKKANLIKNNGTTEEIEKVLEYYRSFIDESHSTREVLEGISC